MTFDTERRQKVKAPPRVETDRLLLRAFVAGDAALLAELAGARDIADTMISIPHPFSLAAAQRTIASHAASFRSGRGIHFAIETKDAARLVGGAELRDVDTEHSQAELSFWIGKPVWGRGYASEAARAVVCFGFEALDLNRIYACHMIRNPASGAVLRKAGMKQEGILRDRVRKWGVFEDVALYAILRLDLAAAW